MVATTGIASGALLLLMLTATSFSFPSSKGGLSNSGSYGSPGLLWDEPLSSGTAGHTAPRGQPEGLAPVRESAAASASSGSLSAPVALPVASGFTGSSPVGLVRPGSFQPPSDREVNWMVAPPGPFSGENPSARPSAQRPPSQPAPEASGPGYVSPPLPMYQGGELYQTEDSFEHGNYESETEERGYLLPPPPPPGAPVLMPHGPASEVQPSPQSTGWYPYPYDYMLLTGQYPPGTYTYASESYEQGADHWQDAHYIREYYPAQPQLVKTLPAEPQVPQRKLQPRQPVRQSVGQPRWRGGSTGLYNRKI